MDDAVPRNALLLPYDAGLMPATYTATMLSSHHCAPVQAGTLRSLPPVRYSRTVQYRYIGCAGIGGPRLLFATLN